MLIAEARVETDRPGRYLVQLCRHAGHMGRSGRLRSYLSNDAIAPSETPIVDAEWSQTRGAVRIGDGVCTMQVAADALFLRAEAPDEDTLAQIEQAIARNLGRFGRRDRLTVQWQRADPTDLEPGSARETPPERSRTSRRRRWTLIVLAVVVALLIAVHLGLGGSVLSAAPAKWATNTLLALVALKVIFIAAHVVPGVALGRFALRRRNASTAARRPANATDRG